MAALCTIITIGDEILIGQTIDTNSAFLAQHLNKIGIRVHEILSVSDTAESIYSGLERATKSSKSIITTGGLGPTQDDITKKVLADYFQVGLKRDKQTYEHVKAFFETRQRPFLPINETQADVPENAEVLFNAKGTAPGMYIQRDGKHYFSLPGVPFEMKYLYTKYIDDILRKNMSLPSLYYAHIQTFGVGESFLADKIQSVEKSLPDYITLSYLPSPYLVHLRLSSTTEHQAEVDDFATQIKEIVVENVYSDTEETIDKVFHDYMLSSSLKLCTVESCTGGFLAHSITNNTGSSTYFNGGWNVYTNEFKMSQLDVPKELLDQYTAVSSECVEVLLKNGIEKSESDLGIAIVGYLEKDEGIMPHAYIAYGTQENYLIEKIDLFYPRDIAKIGLKNLAFCKLLQKAKSL